MQGERTRAGARQEGGEADGDTVLSGELLQAVRQATNREEGGCLLPEDQCTKPGRPVAEVLREKHPDMRVPPVKNPTCAAVEEYEDVPETVLLDITEDDVTWVTLRMASCAGRSLYQGLQFVCQTSRWYPASRIRGRLRLPLTIQVLVPVLASLLI